MLNRSVLIAAVTIAAFFLLGCREEPQSVKVSSEATVALSSGRGVTVFSSDGTTVVIANVTNSTGVVVMRNQRQVMFLDLSLTNVAITTHSRSNEIEIVTLDRNGDGIPESRTITEPGLKPIRQKLIIVPFESKESGLHNSQNE